MFGQAPNGTPCASSFFGQISPTPTNPFSPGLRSDRAQTSPFSGSNLVPALGATFLPLSSMSASVAAPSAFGSSTSEFGSFGTSTSPFGCNSTTAFVTSSSPAIGTFGAFSTATFGTSPAPAFGNVSSSPAFGTSSSPFGNGSASVPGASSALAFGGFGSSSFGGNCKGSRVKRYTATTDNSSNNEKIESLCAMETYINKSQEELRLEDYQLGDKGALTHANRSQAIHLSSLVSHSKSNLFPSPPIHSNPFAPRTSLFGPLGTGVTRSIGVNPSPSPFSLLTAPVISTSRIGGSRMTSYTTTSEEEASRGTMSTGKINSLSAMIEYRNKSHEELRFEDYHRGDRGGLKNLSQSAGGHGVVSSSPQETLFSFPSVFNNSSNGSCLSPNAFASQKVVFPLGNGGSSTSTQDIHFDSFKSNQMDTQTSSFSPLGFNLSTAALDSTSSNPPFSTNPFSMSSLPAPASPLRFTFRSQISGSSSDLSSSPFLSSLANVHSTPAPEISSGHGSWLNHINTQPYQPFQSFPSSDGQMQATSGPSTTPSLPKQNVPSSSSVGVWGYLSSNASGSSEAEIGTGGQGIEEQQSVTMSTEAQQSDTNPFGKPNLAHITVDHPGSAVSIQYGISSRPVSDNPAPVRWSSSLRVRRLSLRRNQPPAEKYNAKSNTPKVPFFTKFEKTPSIFKPDALVVPRENPRSVFNPFSKEWILGADAEKSSGKQSKNTNLYGISGETSEVFGDNSPNEQDSYVTIHGNEDDEATKLDHRHNADVEAVMPKLRRADYYTQPPIQELAEREKAEPGFCRHVKDFVVGRKDYGSIKFLGETDIRKLDLDSLVQFNYREVTVYLDESKRPPVGQGLNKPAEVTLLNIKCIGRNSGKLFIDGPKVDRYRDMLIKKTKTQGAEFVSYNPVFGEWKFKVEHF